MHPLAAKVISYLKAHYDTASPIVVAAVAGLRAYATQRLRALDMHKLRAIDLQTLRSFYVQAHARYGVLVPVSAVITISLAVLAFGGNVGETSVTAELEISGLSVVKKDEAEQAQGVVPFTDPNSVSQLASADLSPQPSLGTPELTTGDPAEVAKKEPNLAGLAEIPKELLWKQTEKKDDDTRRKPSFAAFSEARENLPWDAVEPVALTPLSGLGSTAQNGNAPGAAPAALSGPAKVPRGDIGSWLKGKATEIRGTKRARPFYHFQLWLEPPETTAGHVVGVSYDFSSPAIRPQSQASSDRGSGFRINAGGLACAEEITVTLRFDDGRVEKAQVDGCKLFS